MCAREAKAHPHKVGGLLWLESPRSDGHWLLSQDTNGLVRIWELLRRDGSPTLRPLCRLLATPPKGRSGPLTFAQSACTLPPEGRYGGALVLGDRAGRMSAYIWAATESCPQDMGEPAVRIQVHGDETVTCIVRSRSAPWVLRSVGRDGYLVDTELSSEGADNAALRLVILRRHRVRRRVDWLSQYWPAADDDDTLKETGAARRDLVLAFSKKDMLVLDLGQDEEV